MTLSEMFDLIRRADYYIKVPQFLRDAKSIDVPYVEITGVISRTLIRTKELANQSKGKEWVDSILETNSVKHERFSYC